MPFLKELREIWQS